MARDGIRFTQIFGGMVLQSTPHLYLSGVPFLPKKSILSEHQEPKFPRIAKVNGGQDNWPALQHSIRAHSRDVISVAFSPDGKRIVSGSDDKTICIWDAETGLQVHSPLKGHSDWVWSVAFSPDGKRIVSGSSDKTICIWDAETGLQAHSPLKGHSDRVLSVAFSPDGKRIVSGSSDQTICIWDAENISTVKLSTNPSHALCSALDFFGEVSGPGLYYVCLDTDGWIVGPQGRLLMWIPPASRLSLHPISANLTIPRSNVQLDLSIMAHGRMWSQCCNL